MIKLSCLDSLNDFEIDSAFKIITFFVINDLIKQFYSKKHVIICLPSSEKWQNVGKFDEKWRSMAKCLNEMAESEEFGGLSAKFGKIWRATSKILRDLAEKFKILAESGRKQQNLEKYCNISRKRVRCGEIFWKSLRMIWTSLILYNIMNELNIAKIILFQ